MHGMSPQKTNQAEDDATLPQLAAACATPARVQI